MKKKNNDESLPNKDKKSVTAGFVGTDHIIQIFDDNNMLIEGCKEVVLYDEEQIIIKAKRRLKVTGRKLHLTNLSNGNMAISGNILTIEFGDKQK